MSGEGKGLTKWQVAALGVGAVAVVAGGALVAYACVKRRRRPIKADPEPVPPSRGEKAESGSRSEAGAASQPASEPKNALERARVMKQQGNEFYKQQKFDEAIKCYQEAIKVCPPESKEDLAIFHQNIGAVYDQMASRASDKDEKTSHYHSVIEACTASLEHNPRYIKAITRRMKAQHSLGNNHEALMDITRACLIDESQGRNFAEVLPVILKEIGRQKSEELYPKLGPLAPTRNMVKNYFESFEWKDDISEARLRALWLQNPTESAKPESKNGHSVESAEDDAAAASEEPQEDEGGEGEGEPEVDLYEGFSDEPFVQAAAKFQADDYHGILELLTDAVERGHSMYIPHALLLRGTLYSLWREDKKALKDLQEIVNTREQDKEMCVSALVRRAGIFAGSGEMDKCKSCLDKAQAIHSNAVDVYIHRARIYLEVAESPTQLATVLEDLEKATKMAPNSPHAAYSLATAFHRIAGMTQSMQTLQQAKAKFDEARGKFPEFADGLILYSLFLQDFQQFDEAEQVLNKAAKLQPENPLCHFSLGLISIVKTGSIAGGVKHMEKAVEVDSSCVQAYDTLAAFEMQKGNLEGALDLYSKAIQNSRTVLELSQTITSKEVVEAQDRACQEYGVSPSELASRTMPAAGLDNVSV